MPYLLDGSEDKASDLLASLRYANWWSLPNLMQCINEIRKINYSVIEQRHQALERLSGLPNSDPLAVGRFIISGNPGRGFFVCELLGDWPRKFQQLRMALSSRDLPATRRDEQASAKSYDDSFVSFWSVTTAMLDEMRRLDGVWNRDRFEDHFNLEWHDEEAQ
jgi:hypothetical protein